MHSLALEVRSQRATTIRTILECPVSVCGESTGKHTNIPEDTFQWLVQDITDLVLEVLRCSQWARQEKPTAATNVDTDSELC